MNSVTHYGVNSCGLVIKPPTADCPKPLVSTLMDTTRETELLILNERIPTVSALATKLRVVRNIMFVAFAVVLAATVAAADSPSRGIPVILDTDIGDDIDDTWALALLLNCPELDVRLVVSDHAKGRYRAALIAKLLEVAQRTDIPVGIGVGPTDGTGRQQQWIANYDLGAYPGTVHDDGVQAMIDLIMKSEEPITVLAIGPVPNLAAALRREPRIAERARFVGMHGSVRKGYGNSATPAAEYNVRADPSACQAVFRAPWEMTITPLDTCGVVVLRGDKYAHVRDCEAPLMRALIENYRIWHDQTGKVPSASSTLFDTVAVYLAISDDLCRMETLPIRVTDEGMTVIDEAGKPMRVAAKWRDLEGFEHWLVERLTGKKTARAHLQQ